jgi:hypothetical protein
MHTRAYAQNLREPLRVRSQGHRLALSRPLAERWQCAVESNDAK